MQKSAFDPWHFCQRGRKRTQIRPVLFLLGYYICMGIERRKNKKEKKSILKTIAGEAIVAAGALAALHAAAESKKTQALSDTLPPLQISDSAIPEKHGDHKEWQKFRRAGVDVDDRREHTSFRFKVGSNAIDQHKQLAEEAQRKVLENSKLAKDLGINDIGKTPKHVLGAVADKRKAQIDAAIKKARNSVLGPDQKKK